MSVYLPEVKEELIRLLCDQDRVMKNMTLKYSLLDLESELNNDEEVRDVDTSNAVSMSVLILHKTRDYLHSKYIFSNKDTLHLDTNLKNISAEVLSSLITM